MLDLAGLELTPVETEQLRHSAVGGVILFTRNYQDPQQLTALVRSIRAIRPGLLIAADTEGGRVQRFRQGFLRLPAARCYGDLYARDAAAALQVAYAGGWLLAAELRALDIDLAFAPVVDVDAGVSQVIGDRAFGGQADRVAALAGAFAQGMRAAGMAATAKHFPGHGGVAPDSHLELPCDSRTAVQLQRCDALPYRTLMGDGLESVMVAHVQYQAIDAQPASVSERWIKQILRAEMGFSGAVFSDDLSMGGLRSLGTVRQRFAAARTAGCDMIPVCNQPDDVASLLDSGLPAQDRAASQRLQRLRGAAPAQGLGVLRASADYARNFNIVSTFLEVEYQS